MLRPFPRLPRLYSKLLCELVPGALVCALGALLLNQYYFKPPGGPAAAAGSDIVQVVRDEQARFLAYLKDEPAGERAVPPAPDKTALESRPASKPLTAAEGAPKRSARPAVRRTTTVAGQPLQIATAPADAQTQTQAQAQAQAAAQPPAAPRENIVLAKWRDVSGAVQQLPARVRSTASGWFAETAPPRPPEPIPGPTS